MAEHKEYTVELVVTTVHQYNILARTPEEAISTAEGLLDDGNDGEITETLVESSDAIASDEYVAEEYTEEEYTIEP